MTKNNQSDKQQQQNNFLYACVSFHLSSQVYGC